MSEEIKEILINNIKNEIETTKEKDFALCIEQWKQLLDYITTLQEKINQYENPDDMTLFYMWLDEKAKDKLKKLQQEVEELRKYKKNATRKHWQQKCAEHHVQEKIYKSRYEKAIEEYTKTYRSIYYTMKYYRDSKQIEKCDVLYNDCIKKLDELDLLNILNGSDENE